MFLPFSVPQRGQRWTFAAAVAAGLIDAAAAAPSGAPQV
jgi:hypothetical protein